MYGWDEDGPASQKPTNPAGQEVASELSQMQADTQARRLPRSAAIIRILISILIIIITILVLVTTLIQLIIIMILIVAEAEAISAAARLRPISILRFWISEGLTQA